MTTRAAQVTALSRDGFSDSHIAEVLGISDRTVRRIRAAHRVPSRWTPTPPAHGTRSRYQRGCPCTPCKRANAAYAAQDRAARARALRARQRAANG